MGNNYMGVKCPGCRGKFAAADDIVVCPLCGAPHHRQCYAERGQCVFTQDHITGKEWRPPAVENVGESSSENEGRAQRETAKLCYRCGSNSQPEALFCQICGQSLTAGNTPPPSAGQLARPGGHTRGAAYTYNPNGQNNYDQSPYDQNSCYVISENEPINELSARDVAMYVGPNYTYFLPRFLHMEKTGRVIQPNIAAVFFNFFYYFYRKMYLVGAGMLAAFLLCLVPFFMIFWEFLPEALYQSGFAGPPEVPVDMYRIELYSIMFTGALILNFVFSIVISLFANRLYYKQAAAKIREVMYDYPVVQEYRIILPRVGGVNRISIVLLVGTLIVGFNIVGSILIFNSNLL